MLFRSKWLLEPKQLDDSGRLWRPGIKIGVKPNSFFHQTEVFGPVLGLIKAKDLTEALEIQNGTEVGLTAGIHTLNAGEIKTWLQNIEAGNLYVNRGITGAIVERQPFGGFKRSAVGYGLKAGGRNHLMQFGAFEEAGSIEPISSTPEWLPPILALVEPNKRDWLLQAAASDAYWLKNFYEPAKLDGGNLEVEGNYHRYINDMKHVIIRVSKNASPAELARLTMSIKGYEYYISVDPGFLTVNNFDEEQVRVLIGDMWG